MGITRFNQVLEGTDKYVPSDLPVNLMERTLRKKQKEYDEGAQFINNFNTTSYGVPTRPDQGDQNILIGHVNDYKDQMREALKKYNGDVGAAKNELQAIAGNFFIDDKTKKLQQAKAVYDETEAFKQKNGESAYIFNNHLAPLADKDGNLQFLQPRYDKFRDVDKEIQDAVGKSFGFTDNGTINFDDIDRIYGKKSGDTLSEYNKFISSGKKFDANTTQAQMFIQGVQQGSIRINNDQVDKAYESAAQNILTNPEVVANTEIEADRISKAQGVTLDVGRKIYKDKILQSLKDRADSWKTQLVKIPQLQTQVIQGQKLSDDGNGRVTTPAKEEKEPARVADVIDTFVVGGNGLNEKTALIRNIGESVDNGSVDTDLTEIKIYKDGVKSSGVASVPFKNINTVNIGLMGGGNVPGYFTPAATNVGLDDVLAVSKKQNTSEQAAALEGSGFGLTLNLGSSDPVENQKWSYNHIREMYKNRSLTLVPTLTGGKEIIPNTTFPLNGDAINMPFANSKVNTVGFFQIRNSDGTAEYAYGMNPTISRMKASVNEDADVLYNKMLKSLTSNGTPREQAMGYAEAEKRDYIEKVNVMWDTANNAGGLLMKDIDNKTIIDEQLAVMQKDLLGRQKESAAVDILVQKNLGKTTRDLSNNPFISEPNSDQVRLAAEYEYTVKAEKAPTQAQQDSARLVNVDQVARASVIRTLFGIKDINAFAVSSDLSGKTKHFLGDAAQRETVLDTAYIIAVKPELLKPQNKDMLLAYMIQAGVKNGLFTKYVNGKQVTDYTALNNFVNKEGLTVLGNRIGVNLVQYAYVPQGPTPVISGGSFSSAGNNFDNISSNSTYADSLIERLESINNGKIMLAGAGKTKDNSETTKDVLAEESEYHLQDNTQLKIAEANRAYYQKSYINSVEAQFKDGTNKTASNYLTQNPGVNHKIREALVWRNIVNGRTIDKMESVNRRILTSTNSQATDESYNELWGAFGNYVASGSNAMYFLENHSLRNQAPFLKTEEGPGGLVAIGLNGSGQMLSVNHELQKIHEDSLAMNVSKKEDGDVSKDGSTLSEFIKNNSSEMAYVLHPQQGPMLAVTLTFKNTRYKDSPLQGKTIMVPVNSDVAASEAGVDGSKTLLLNDTMYKRVVGTDWNLEHVATKELARQFKENSAAPAYVINGNLTLEVVQNRNRENANGYVYSILDISTGAPVKGYDKVSSGNMLGILQAFESQVESSQAETPDLSAFVKTLKNNTSLRTEKSVLAQVHQKYPHLKGIITTKEQLVSLHNASKDIVIEKEKSIPDGAIIGDTGDLIYKNLQARPLPKGDYFLPHPSKEPYNVRSEADLSNPNGGFMYSRNVPMFELNKVEVKGMVLTNSMETKLKGLLNNTVGLSLDDLAEDKTVLNSSLRSFKTNRGEETADKQSKHLIGEAVDFKAITESGGWAGGFTEYSMRHILGLKPTRAGKGLGKQEINNEKAIQLSKELAKHGFYLLVHSPLHLHLEYNPAKAGHIQIEWGDDNTPYNYKPQ